MHTRKKGKSASHKPFGKSSYAWVQADKTAVLKVIEKLSKEGKSEANIGRVLRDEHGVPSVKVLFGVKLGRLLKENNLQTKYPSDLMSLIHKAVNLARHGGKNKRDYHNRIKLGHVESKIKRLVYYYRGKRLPADWKYDREEAALLVK